VERVADKVVGRAEQLRRRLHGANDELSIAVLQLNLLLEESSLDPGLRAVIEETLQACNAAAEELRAVWGLLDRTSPVR
jgi:hypothetical protein